MHGLNKKATFVTRALFAFADLVDRSRTNLYISKKCLTVILFIMKKNSLVLFVVMLLMAMSCNDERDQYVDISTNIEEDLIVGGRISITRAIANAEFIYKNTGGYKNKKIQSIDLLTTTDVKAELGNTRSTLQAGDEASPLAYVVNYANDEGYVILAANTQLPPVISLGDEGNFSTFDFVKFARGNAETRSNMSRNSVQELQYALVNNSLLLPPIDLGDLVTLGVDTTVMLKCMPLVLTKWGQRDPYDFYSPMDSVENKKSAAGCVPVAGAQTLAALCYHHDWRPTVQISDNYDMDWYTINSLIYSDIYKFSSGDRSGEAMAVASLIRAIGEEINAKYTYDVTLANTSSLRQVYLELGMTSALYGNEKSQIPITKDDIFDMIVCKNYPVTARATASVPEGEPVGHSFVLDGWLRLGYTVLGRSTSDEAADGVIGDRPDSFQRNFDLVHVNFGWDGLCDGYYLPDAFDLTEEKYLEYAEEGDLRGISSYVFDIGVSYLIYDL